MLIAEDLLLLLLDEESRKLTKTRYMEECLGGALLVELALGGYVEAIPWRFHEMKRVRITGAPAPKDPGLVIALARVAEKDGRWSTWRISVRLGEEMKQPLLAHLVQVGVLRRHDDKVWGLIPRRRWELRDGRHRHNLIRQIGDVLTRRVDPEPRTAGLVALLDGLKWDFEMIDRRGTSEDQLVSRIHEVRDGAGWPANEVAGMIASLIRAEENS